MSPSGRAGRPRANRKNPRMPCIIVLTDGVHQPGLAGDSLCSGTVALGVHIIARRKIFRTRSSWTGGPGFLRLPRLGLPNTDHQPFSEQLRHTVRSDTRRRPRRASSARNR